MSAFSALCRTVIVAAVMVAAATSSADAAPAAHARDLSLLGNSNGNINAQPQQVNHGAPSLMAPAQQGPVSASAAQTTAHQSCVAPAPVSEVPIDTSRWAMLAQVSSANPVALDICPSGTKFTLTSAKIYQTTSLSLGFGPSDLANGACDIRLNFPRASIAQFTDNMGNTYNLQLDQNPFWPGQGVGQSYSTDGTLLSIDTPVRVNFLKTSPSNPTLADWAVDLHCRSPATSGSGAWVCHLDIPGSTAGCPYMN